MRDRFNADYVRKHKTCPTHNRKFIILISFTLIALLSFHCTKEDRHIDGLTTQKEVGYNGLLTLPVNLNMFNLASGTKSSATADTTFYMNLDSLIDFTKTKEVVFSETGNIYQQSPFKLNELGLYASLTKGTTYQKDSLVTVKSFFLLVYGAQEKRLYKYIVTMIPTKHYATSNPEYDYLTKPSYSGLILYSDIDGTLIRSEYLVNGVIGRTSLIDSDTYNSVTKGNNNPTHSHRTKNSSTVKCSKCDALTYEKDGVCIVCKVHELNICRIFANNPHWTNYLFGVLRNLATPEIDDEEINEFDDYKYYVGGGGIKDNDTKYVVKVNAKGCFNQLLTAQVVTSGSPFGYTAIHKTDKECFFKKWELGELPYENFSLENNSIYIKSVTSNIDLNAVYQINKACSEIDTLLNSTELSSVLMYLLNEIYNGSDSSKIEYASVWYQNDKKPTLIKGTSSRVTTTARKLIHKSHYHPTQKPAPSTNDYVSMCLFFLLQAANGSSVYSITTMSDVILIKMKDKEKFNKFLEPYKVNKSKPKWEETLKTKLSEEFSELYREKVIYKNCINNVQFVYRVNQIVSNMGLEVFWGELNVDNDGSNIEEILIDWYHTDYNVLSPIKLGCTKSSIKEQNK